MQKKIEISADYRYVQNMKKLSFMATALLKNSEIFQNEFLNSNKSSERTGKNIQVSWIT